MAGRRSEPRRPPQRRERLLLVAYSQQEIASGESAVAAGELAKRAVDGGRLLQDVGPAAPEMWSAVTGLIIGCRYAAAGATITAASDLARQRGSSFGYAMALCFGGLLAYRRGHLSQAVTDERQAMAMLRERHVAAIRDYAAAFLAHALIDTGDLELGRQRTGHAAARRSASAGALRDSRSRPAGDSG